MSTYLIENSSLRGSPAAEFLDDVLKGLSSASRSLPSKYFYDDIGSMIFDEICELDEYYPTRVESEIMHRYGVEIACRLGSDVRLVEYGSGSSTKTRILLDHSVDPSLYVPVDISNQHLARTADALARDYPLLTVAPVAADFTRPFELPQCEFEPRRTCIYFPGSTIGNFAQAEAIQLLADIAHRCGHGDGLLIGFDLRKDINVLESAYNDRAGVTAAFNKNLLHRMNSELGANFDTRQFGHHAFFNDAVGRIEMHLVSQREQSVSIADHSFRFDRSETICTEYSHKYSISEFQQMTAQVGWRCKETWTDEREYFAVMYLEQ
jgi:dimethylhistidine N-methyltransferase